MKFHQVIRELEIVNKKDLEHREALQCHLRIIKSDMKAPMKS